MHPRDSLANLSIAQWLIGEMWKTSSLRKLVLRPRFRLLCIDSLRDLETSVDFINCSIEKLPFLSASRLLIEPAGKRHPFFHSIHMTIKQIASHFRAIECYPFFFLLFSGYLFVACRRCSPLLSSNVILLELHKLTLNVMRQGRERGGGEEWKGRGKKRQPARCSNSIKQILLVYHVKEKMKWLNAILLKHLLE